MAESLTATLSQSLNVQHQGFAVGLQSLSGSFVVNADQTFTFGTGAAASEINEIYAAQRTLAATLSEELDLAGILANAARTAIIFNRVKYLLIRLADTTNQAESITVGGAATNAWLGPFLAVTERVKILKGGHFEAVAVNLTGYPVTAGTVDKLKILNDSATLIATYDIVLLGTKP